MTRPLLLALLLTISLDSLANLVLESVQEPLAEGRQALARAYELTENMDGRTQKEIRDNLLRANRELATAQELYATADRRLREVAVATRRIEAERNTLEKAKSELESREKLFSFGFYASLTAALLAMSTILLKLPTLKLDKQYRSLEVQEKELQLAERRANLEKAKVESPPNAA